MLKLRSEWRGVKEGAKFDRLTVLGPQFKVHKWRVVCRCDCGTVSVLAPAFVARKVPPARSCGCLLPIRLKKSPHRGAKTLIYGVWAGMKRRCYCRSSPSYKDYGGRGITVCDEWIKNFSAFRDWALSHGYKRGLQIDRKNNNLGYSPENCRFVTPQVNSNNRRSSRLYTWKNETKTLKQWSEDIRCAVSYGTLKDRLDYGWPFQTAFTTKAHRNLS